MGVHDRKMHRSRLSARVGSCWKHGLWGVEAQKVYSLVVFVANAAGSN